MNNSYRKRHKCAIKYCKRLRLQSIYVGELLYCLIHAIDSTGDINELPNDTQEEIAELLSINSPARNELISAIQEQHRRNELKRLNILSNALN